MFAWILYLFEIIRIFHELVRSLLTKYELNLIPEYILTSKLLPDVNFWLINDWIGEIFGLQVLNPNSSY